MNINEISLKTFLAALNSRPKVKIKTEEVTNPSSGAVIKKNFVGEFLKE